MFNMAIALLGAFATQGVAQKSPVTIDPFIYRGRYVEEIIDPGFEASVFSPWNNSGGIQSVGGDENTISLGYVSTTHHTGSRGFDMNVGQGGYNGYYECNLYQPLNGFGASRLVNASVWALAGGQYLDVTVYYSDGTASYASHYFDALSALQSDPTSGGWSQWNFLSIINKTKSVTGIMFTADSFEGDDIVIDDVEMLCSFPIY